MTDDDFVLKRALDALPRSIEPPADAWPAIRGRIVGAGSARRRTTAAAVPRPRQAVRMFNWPEVFEPRTLRLAAAVGILGIGLAVFASIERTTAHWTIAGAVGRPWIAGSDIPGGRISDLPDDRTRPATGTTHSVVQSGRTVLAGSRMTTDATSRLTLNVGTIGSVELERGTSARLLASGLSQQHLALDRGRIHVWINAPPQLFVVETPAGTVVDMGCEYLMHVDSVGTTTLEVRLGWVVLHDGDREALVPGGFHVTTRRGGTFGIPVRQDAQAPLRWAAARLEAGTMTDSALAVLLRESNRWDAVTLWHVLDHVDGANREVVFDHLAAWVPLPEGVTRAGVLDGDRMMRQLWWEKLPLAYPITPDFTRRVWMLWLKAAAWL